LPASSAPPLTVAQLVARNIPLLLAPARFGRHAHLAQRFHHRLGELAKFCTFSGLFCVMKLKLSCPCRGTQRRRPKPARDINSVLLHVLLVDLFQRVLVFAMMIA